MSHQPSLPQVTLQLVWKAAGYDFFCEPQLAAPKLTEACIPAEGGCCCPFSFPFIKFPGTNLPPDLDDCDECCCICAGAEDPEGTKEAATRTSTECVDVNGAAFPDSSWEIHSLGDGDGTNLLPMGN